MKKSVAAPLLVALLAIPAGALAQSDADRINDLEKRVESLVKKDKARTAEEEKAKAGKGTTLRSASDKGKLEWASADGTTSFRLVGRVQLDGVAFSGSENRLANAVTLRRIRIGYKARIAKDWVSEIDVDFAENAVDVKDAFIGYEGIKNSTIQAGHFKVPFGMDTLTSSKDIWFVERNYGDSWTPDRRLGLAYAYGGERFSAKADFFAQTISVDATGVDQGWGGRGPLHVRSRDGLGDEGGPPRRRGHTGASRTRRPRGAPRLPPSPTDRLLLASRVHEGEQGEVPRDARRWNRSTGCSSTPASSPASGTPSPGRPSTTQTKVTRRSGNPTLVDHDFDTWYGQVSYLINGKRKYAAGEGLVDKVSPGKGGAYEVLARYSTMDLNDLTAVDAIKGGSAKNFTLGANWYPNTNVRVMLNWTRVNNDENAKPKKAYGGIANDDFDEFQFRVQFAF